MKARNSNHTVNGSDTDLRKIEEVGGEIKNSALATFA